MVGGAPPRVPAVRAVWVARVCDIRILLFSSFRYTTILGRSVGDEGDVGGGVPEVVVQAGDEGAEKKLVGDLLTEVTELVNKLLEAHAIIVNG